MNVLGLAVGVALGMLFGASHLSTIAGTLGLSFSILSLPLQIVTAPVSTLTGLFGAVWPVLLSLLTLHTVITALFYVMARNAVAGAGLGAVLRNNTEFFARGALAGICAGANFVLLMAILGATVVGIPLGILFGLLALILVGAAAFPGASQGRVYQGFLSWAAWMLPMTWVIQILGLTILILDIVARMLGLPALPLFGGTANPAMRLRFDWRFGAVIVHGGFFTIQGGGYTAGNIVFVNFGHTNQPDTLTAVSGLVETFRSVTQHELGHTLSGGAFGSLFWIVGALDQNVFSAPPGTQAYSEQAAESNRRMASPVDRWVDLWGTAANTPPTATIATTDGAIVVPVGTGVTAIAGITDPEPVEFVSFYWEESPTGLPGSFVPATPPFGPSLAINRFAPATVTLSLIVNDGIQNSAPATLTLTWA